MEQEYKGNSNTTHDAWTETVSDSSLITSNILYLSKVTKMYECPRRYFLRHYLHLNQKTKKAQMQFGAEFHDLAKTMNESRYALAVAELQANMNAGNVSEEDAYEQATLLTLLKEKQEEKGLRQMLVIEEAMPTPLAGPYFTSWFIKSDAIAEFDDGLWNVEYKTTSGFGAATKNYYHNSMQTVTYFRNVKERYPDVKGTRLFVLVRAKREPRCEVEDILLTKHQLEVASRFEDASVEYAERLEATRHFPRFGTKCMTIRAGECEYNPICWQQSGAYVKEVIENIYEKSDPDAHLGLSGEE